MTKFTNTMFYKAERSGRGRVAVLCKAGCPVAGFHGKAQKAHQSRKECAGGRGTRLAEKFTPRCPLWASLGGRRRCYEQLPGGCSYRDGGRAGRAAGSWPAE